MEDTLVVPLPAGSNAADVRFDELYRSSRDDVYAYVAALLRDRGAAEDITAAAFERAFRKRRSFNARRGSARAWLFGIARNAALDELRRRTRTAPLATEVVVERQVDDDEEEEKLSRRTSLRSALAALTPRERELIALKFHAALTNQEIARVLGTSVTNAGTMLHRTIQKLRKACNET
jgi:RNA polymerase sigma-70 factor (ECF subfamily)